MFGCSGQSNAAILAYAVLQAVSYGASQGRNRTRSLCFKKRQVVCCCYVRIKPKGVGYTQCYLPLRRVGR